MDKPAPMPKSAHLLDDLESIRQLLGDDSLEPPLLTDTVDEQIPLLLEPAEPAPEPAPAAA
ncbi:DNA polymerase III subunit chi, partial [Pseudomonas sp. MAFF212427]|nr:DNA polymerase III subunit chi [Pseudomonas brassicae]